MSVLAALHSVGEGLGLIAWIIVAGIVIAAAVAAWRGVWIVALALAFVAIVAAAIL
jgi:hypothetical protein